MSITTTQPEEITEFDLATVEYFFAVCTDCKTCTNDHAESCEAIYVAKQLGWEMVDGLLYCGNCAEVEKLRLIDEAEEEAAELAAAK